MILKGKTLPTDAHDMTNGQPLRGVTVTMSSTYDTTISRSNDYGYYPYYYEDNNRYFYASRCALTPDASVPILSERQPSRLCAAALSCCSACFISLNFDLSSSKSSTVLQWGASTYCFR